MRLADFIRIVLLAWLLGLGLAGCAHVDEEDTVDIGDNPYDPDDLTEKAAYRPSDRPHKHRVFGAEALYHRGRRNLDRQEYTAAVKEYDKLISKYPFTDYATQGSLERVYCLFKSDQPDEAQVAADRFVREHPRHAEIDYVTYLRGLIDGSRDDSMYELLPLQNDGRDVDYRRRAFEDFALLVQRYPKSPYVGDARLRMIDLRNRIAAHDLAVARFYLRRGAYVASARRAQEVVQNYPGAPATLEALATMQQANEELGLKVQAQQVGQVIAANRDLKPITMVAQAGNTQVASDAVPRMAPAPRALVDIDTAAKAQAKAAAAADANQPGFFGRVAHSVGLGGGKPPAPIASTAMSPSTDTPHAGLNAPDVPADTGAAVVPAAASTSGIPPVTEAPHGFWNGVKHTFGLQPGGSAGARPSAQSKGIAGRSTEQSTEAAPADAGSGATPMTATTPAVPETPAAAAVTPAADAAAPAAASSSASSGGFWSGVKHTLNLQPGGSAATHATPQAHGIAAPSDVSDRAQAQEKADFAAQQAAQQAAESARARAIANGETPPPPPADPGSNLGGVHMHFLDRSSNPNGPASTPAAPATKGVAPRVDMASQSPPPSPAEAAPAADPGSEGPATQPYPSAHGIAPRVPPHDAAVASATPGPATDANGQAAAPKKEEKGFFRRLADFLFGP